MGKNIIPNTINQYEKIAECNNINKDIITELLNIITSKNTY